MVSYNEDVEADNLRQNYRMHGVQYVSYELMLPPRFPLPFVGEAARRGLFFTTIMRDPFKVRILSFNEIETLRHYKSVAVQKVAHHFEVI